MALRLYVYLLLKNGFEENANAIDKKTLRKNRTITEVNEFTVLLDIIEKRQVSQETINTSVRYIKNAHKWNY